MGKSTLLNALIGSKISIISPIPQTTRHNIKGVLNLKDAQIVFIDTPGMHSFKDKLAGHFNARAKHALIDCDLILYVVDVSRGIGAEEEKLVEVLAYQKAKIIMVLNKLDLGQGYLKDYIDFWENKVKTNAMRKKSLAYYLPVSAKMEKNMAELKDVIVENLPESEPFYDQNTVTDFPVKFRVADIVREKLFLSLKNELPHSIAVEVDNIEDKDRIVSVLVNIYVNRNSQKKIVVGKHGEILKNVGVAARPEIEEIFGKRVYLDLWVKVLGNWQDKPRILQELGYW